MCKFCREIDEKIERYRWLASQVTDRETLEAVSILIEKNKTEKVGLHPPLS